MSLRIHAVKSFTFYHICITNNIPFLPREKSISHTRTCIWSDSNILVYNLFLPNALKSQRNRKLLISEKYNKILPSNLIRRNVYIYYGLRKRANGQENESFSTTSESCHIKCFTYTIVKFRNVFTHWTFRRLNSVFLEQVQPYFIQEVEHNDPQDDEKMFPCALPF